MSVLAILTKQSKAVSKQILESVKYAKPIYFLLNRKSD